MATTYFGSKPVSDWTANGPAESGHNFIDQINEQKGKISEQEGRYNTQYGKLDELQNAYDEAYKGQQSYSDLYNQAKASEGVDDARAQYQKSLASVNATNTAMNNLPSSINAGSNVVLNANQRNAALGNQMAKYQNTLDYWTRQNAGDQNMYQTALASAQNLAGQNMSQEQAKVAQAMTNLQTNMDMANKLYDQVVQERALMRQIYGDMYDDEYKHMQQEIEIWANNLQAETTRYIQEQENARNAAKLAAEKATADINKYLGSGYTWNGSEWVAPDNSALTRANDLDRINKIYSQYQSELGDLDRQTSDPGTYFNPFGSNGLFGTGFGFGQTTAQKAQNLRNKGFEDYLYNADPYAQKLLRENYSDLLGMYGIGG